MNAFAHNRLSLTTPPGIDRLRRAHHGRLRRTRRAFTLIEIIVVVTIIAILAAAIAPRLLGRLQWAKENKAESEVKAIASAVEMFILDSGGNLSDDFDLAILLLQPEEGGGPEGPYFKKKKSEELLDPWESPYVIRFPGTVNYDFDIVSAGPDRRVGTDDDITN